MNIARNLLFFFLRLKRVAVCERLLFESSEWSAIDETKSLPLICRCRSALETDRKAREASVKKQRRQPCYSRAPEVELVRLLGPPQLPAEIQVPRAVTCTPHQRPGPLVDSVRGRRERALAALCASRVDVADGHLDARVSVASLCEVPTWHLTKVIRYCCCKQFCNCHVTFFFGANS